MVHVERALAKLTLSLRVVGVRPDGYHLLEAEMVTVDLADELEFAPGDGLELGGLSNGVAAGEDNLVRRALVAAGRTAFIRVHKRIPAGAGLGGGSADAAAVLRWAGIKDLLVASRLGSDVPFCLSGVGRARVGGAGEKVDPLAFEEVDGQPYTLLIPPFGVPTAAVYEKWDRLGGPVAEGPNDLEPAALAVEPRLAEWRDRLGDATGEVPVLAGSGSTWYVAGEFPGDGRLVVRVSR
jgi:4-diphosphocytidyl-2-C-methyl-D-erythritol kinase